MKTQSAQTVKCVFCRHANGAWRSQCEKCGEALNRRDGTDAAMAATVDQRTLYERLTWRSERAERVHHWLLAVGALLFIMRLLGRCSADTQPDIPPLFSNTGAYMMRDVHPNGNDHAHNNNVVVISWAGADSLFTTDSERSDYV